LGISSDYSKIVKLPKDENKEEWIAVHLIDFYNILNRLFSCIRIFFFFLNLEKCNKDTCPTMTCGKDFTYLWKDETKKEYKNATSVTAENYILLSLDKIGSFIDTLPTDTNNPYPKDFMKSVKKMCKWLFRIYCHMMKNHWTEIEKNGLEAHINSNFKHFIYVCEIFF
jgi:MOB kinase activator 1